MLKLSSISLNFKSKFDKPCHLYTEQRNKVLTDQSEEAIPYVDVNKVTELNNLDVDLNDDIMNFTDSGKSLKGGVPSFLPKIKRRSQEMLGKDDGTTPP